MEKTLTAILLFTFCFLLFCRCCAQPLYRKIKIKDNIFTVEIPLSVSGKAKGLGYRSEIAQDCGMLFTFATRQKHAFWMKGMQFPLDLLWIDGSTIVEIIPDVPIPDSGALKIYKPSVPVNKVLELSAGLTEELGILAGDTITFIEGIKDEPPRKSD